MAARGTAGVLEEVRRGMKISTGVRLGPGEGGATAQVEGVVLTSASTLGSTPCTLVVGLREGWSVRWGRRFSPTAVDSWFSPRYPGSKLLYTGQSPT